MGDDAVVNQESITEAPAVTKKREELLTKSTRLNEILKEARLDNGDLDLNKIKTLSGSDKEKTAEIHRMSRDIEAVGTELEQLAKLHMIERETKAREEALSKPNRIALPGANKAGTKGESEGRIEPVQFKSLGQLFVESDAFKGYRPTLRNSPVAEVDVSHLVGHKGWNDFEVKALLDRVAWPPEVTRIPRIEQTPLRTPVVGDLIPQGTTDQMSIKYLEETTFTNAAAPVAEGAQKPESALAFTEKTSSVEQIATVLPMTNQLLEDVSASRSYVDARLGVMMALTEENQLVNGSGSAPNLRGLMNIVGALTQAKGVDTLPDAVHKGITQILTTAFLSPNGVIMHPLDWQRFRLLKDANGIYIWGSPSDMGIARIWGLPVVSTTVATEGTAIVSAFGTAMQIFRRTGMTFAVSDQHSDFFIFNKIMLRVEQRLAFVVFRPSAICLVTGLNT